MIFLESANSSILIRRRPSPTEDILITSKEMGRSRSSSPKPKKPETKKPAESAQPEEEVLRQEIGNTEAIRWLDGVLKAASNEDPLMRWIHTSGYLRKFSKIVKQQSTVLKVLDLVKIPYEFRDDPPPRARKSYLNTECIGELLDNGFINTLRLHDLERGIVATISTHWGVDGRRVRAMQ